MWRTERAIAGFRRSSDRSDRTPPRSRSLQDRPPVTDAELEQVVQEYRRVHDAHHRARRLSPARRHLETRLQELRVQLERLLAQAPVSDSERRRWRSRLGGGAPAPPERTGIRPLLFRGRSDTGSELRLTANPAGTVDAFIDGAAVAVLDEAAELTQTAPDFVFTLDDLQFHETFGVSPSAFAALRESVKTGARPWRRHIPALIEDGLVDRDLGLTARGRRALGLDRAPARHVESGTPAAISTRGPVPSRARESLARALTHTAQAAPRPVLRITASLTRHEDPALARPVVAKATLDVNGRPVRAHVAAGSESEAIGLLESRLRHNLRALAEREIAGRRDGRPPQPGEWRHGNLSTPRPAIVLRPAAERRLIRRKSYTSEPKTAEAAADELLLLDHDFHVFVDAASGEDALVHLRPDGVLALRRRDGDGGYVEPFVLETQPVPTLRVEDAIELLNLTDDPFVFFVDTSSGRGEVLYRRYDGHYGLVSPGGAP